MLWAHFPTFGTEYDWISGIALNSNGKYVYGALQTGVIVKIRTSDMAIADTINGGIFYTSMDGK